jgi:MinD superfamily P-loop ATPase
MALLVIEPTLSGIHDMERVLGVCRHFNVPAAVCINKFDINEDNARSIESYCSADNVEIAAKIPFDNVVTAAMVKGIPVVEFSDGAVMREIIALWNNIAELLNKQ